MKKNNLIGILAMIIVIAGCQSANKNTESTAQPTTSSASGSSTDKKSETQKIVIKPSNVLVPRGLDYSKPVDKFAFGSCADQNKPQPLWKTISKQEPDLFVFMGDNIYASKPEQRPFSEQYKKLDKIPEYREMREKIPFLAIWDDHDYGQNDGGRDNPDKEQARKDFLNYWSYVRDSIGMNQGPLYHSKIIGGTTLDKRKRRRTVSKTVPSIQFIMLDTRWNRDPLVKNPNEATEPLKKYIPNTDPKATILGETQWEWLEDELAKPADFKVLVSSIQVIAQDHGFEKWANFPKERERLFNLIKKTKPHNLIILSGDRHFSSIAQTEIKGWGTLYDITASSINKSSDLDEKDQSYVGDIYKKESFGLANMDWAHKKATFEIKDMDGKTVNTLELSIKK